MTDNNGGDAAAATAVTVPPTLKMTTNTVTIGGVVTQAVANVSLL